MTKPYQQVRLTPKSDMRTLTGCVYVYIYVYVYAIVYIYAYAYTYAYV